MDKKELIAIRELLPADAPFILSTWLKGLLYGGDEFYRRIPRDVYFSNHHRVVERALLSPTTTVKLAVLREDPDVILGYAVFREVGEITILDWVFVKKTWRNIGIAESLIPEKVNAVTNLTRAGAGMLEKHPHVIYNPYL